MGLAPYTAVLMADGGEKRIEDIAPGEIVREALTDAPLEVMDNLNSPAVGMMRVFAKGGRILDLTGDQSILTDAGMIAAQRLAPGTGLRTPAGFVECESTEALMGDYMVYDLQLATTPGNEARVVAGGLVANALQ